jgi:hypothetical protein
VTVHFAGHEEPPNFLRHMSASVGGLAIVATASPSGDQSVIAMAPSKCCISFTCQRCGMLRWRQTRIAFGVAPNLTAASASCLKVSWTCCMGEI